jgi:hypothetical protein
VVEGLACGGGQGACCPRLACINGSCVPL